MHLAALTQSPTTITNLLIRHVRSLCALDTFRWKHPPTEASRQCFQIQDLRRDMRARVLRYRWNWKLLGTAFPEDVSVNGRYASMVLLQLEQL